MPQTFPALSSAPALSRQVAEALSTEIRSGRLASGSKIPTESALARQFGVSRTVVREAVAGLKSQGLLSSRQGSGVYVLDGGFLPLHFDAGLAASRLAVIHMAEVRRALEAEVAALAALRRTPEQALAIRQAILALDQAVLAQGDGVDEDVRFHRAIADAAGNPYLVSTLDYLRQFLHGATRVTRANEARRSDFARQVRQEHEAIAMAIDLGDAQKARRAAARHMDNAIKRIKRADSGFWAQEGVVLAGALMAPKPS